MGHLAGTPRTQQRLFPEALDDSVAEEHAVRFINAVVDSLDLDALGFRHAQPAATGRPSSSPGARRKLYIDGAMNRRRASRRLERATHRTVERLWRRRPLHPDFNTLADFRKDNAPALQQVFRAFVLPCKAWGELGKSWWRSTARNSRRSIGTAGTVRKRSALRR